MNRLDIIMVILLFVSVIVIVLYGKMEKFDKNSSCNTCMPKKEDFTEINKETNKETNKKVKIENIKINEISNGPANLENPDKNDIVDSGDYICYKKKDLENKKEVKKEVEIKCQNESLNEKHQLSDTKIIPNRLLCENNKFGEDIDPSEYYKSIVHPYVANMEDPLFMGYNIAEFNGAAGIREIGQINLDKKMQNPQPNNSIIKNDQRPVLN